MTFFATAGLYLGLSLLLDVEPRGDAAEHHTLAVNLLNGHGLALPGPDGNLQPSARRPPLYPLFLAGVYRLAGADRGWVGAGAAQALLMALSAGLTCMVGARVFDPRTGWLAGCLFALYAAHISLFCELLAENLAIPLSLLLVLALLASRTQRVMGWLAAALFGLLILTKPNAVLLAPVVAVCVLHAAAPRRRVRDAAVASGILLLVLTPWWVRNAAAFGAFVPFSTTGGWNFYLGHHADYAQSPEMGAGADYAVFQRLRAEGLSEPAVDRELYRRGTAFMRANPATEAANLFRKLVVLSGDRWRLNGTLVFVVLLAVGIYLAANTSGSTGRRWTGAGVMTAGIAGWGVQLYVLNFAGLAFNFAGLGVLAAVGVYLQRHRWAKHRLLIAVFLCYCSAGVIYVPLYRIRWTVDWILILYAAAAISALLAALRPVRPRPAPLDAPA